MGSLEPFFNQLQSGNFPSIEDSMKYEGLRLASYHKRPTKYRTSAIKLAKAGFYYAGKDDHVSCFKCGITIGEWEAMDPYIDPLSVHADRAPECSYLNNMALDIPYGAPTVRKDLIKPLRMERQANQMLSSQTSIETDSPNDDAPLFRTPTINSGNTNRNDPSTDRNNVSTAATNANDNHFTSPFGNPTSNNFPFGNNRMNFNDFGGLFGQGAPPAMFDSGLVPPFFANDLDRRPNYNEERARLETFTLWPGTATLRPQELARAGFYYLGAEDRVQCAFCKGLGKIKHILHFVILRVDSNMRFSCNRLRIL